MEITKEYICRSFYDSLHIPISIFDLNNELVRIYTSGGNKQIERFLKDCCYIIEKEIDSVLPVLRFDINGSCWCYIPLEDHRLLFGPVQTGRNPDYLYEGIPEHTWNGFRDISRCLISLLIGSKTELVEKEGSYTHPSTAGKMYNMNWGRKKLNSFDELYECIQNGNLDQLKQIVESGSFTEYLNNVMPDTRTAKTVFLFHLARTYHTALESGPSLNDLTPLTDLYVSEESGYRSLAAYKSGVQRLTYDFTRFVSQFKDVRYSSMINKALLFIKENVYSQISIPELAKHCMVSVSTLQHRFKEETGMSLSERILFEKMSRAGYLLTYTNIPCGDIAFKVGYVSQSYFTKQFKKVTGLTPNKYRSGH